MARATAAASLDVTHGMRPRRPRPRWAVWLLAACVAWQAAACVAWQAAGAAPGHTQRDGQRVGGALLQDSLPESHVLKHEYFSSPRLSVAALSKINASRRGASSVLGGDHQGLGLRRREQELLENHKLNGDGNAEVPLIGFYKTASTNPAGTIPKFDLTSELELALAYQLKQLNTNNSNKLLNNNFKISTNNNQWERPEAFRPVSFSPRSLNFDIQNLTDKIPKQRLSPPLYTTLPKLVSSAPANSHLVPNVTSDQKRLTDKAFLIDSTPASTVLFNGTVINNLPYRRINSSLVSSIPPPIHITLPSSNDQYSSDSEMASSLISFYRAVPGVSGDTAKESASELGDGISLHVYRNEVKINNISDEAIRTTVASVIEDMMDNRKNSNDNPNENNEDVISMKSYSEVNATSSSKSVESNVKFDADAAANVTRVANVTNHEPITLDELTEIFEILKTIDWHDVKENLLLEYSQQEHDAFNLTVHDLQHEHEAVNHTVHDMKHEHETVNLTVHEFSSNITDSDELPNIEFLGVDCDDLDDFGGLDPTLDGTDLNAVTLAQTVNNKTDQATDVINNFIVQEPDMPSPGAPRSRTGPAPGRKCSDLHGRRHGHPSPILARSLPHVPRAVRRSGNARQGSFIRGPLEVLFSFNDHLLPVPIMRSTPPKNDLLSHLFSAANPIPYAMESYVGVRNMFNQKMEPVMRFYNNMNVPVRPALRNLMPAFREGSRSMPQIQNFQQRPTGEFINTPLPLKQLPLQNEAQPNFPPPIISEQFPPNAIVSKTLESETTRPIVTQLDNFDIIHTTVTSTLAPVTTPATVRPSDRLINIQIPTSTGKNPTFEINLMADGNIGILPVSGTNLKNEVPLISLQSMFNSVSAVSTSQQQAPDVTESPTINLNTLYSFQQNDPQHISDLLSALPPVPRRQVAAPTHFMPPTHPVPPPVDLSFVRHKQIPGNEPPSLGNVLSTNNWHVSAPSTSRLNNGMLLSNTFGQRTNTDHEATSKSYIGITTPSSFGTLVPIDKNNILGFPQIRYQTDPFMYGIEGLKNNYNNFNAPYSTGLPSTKTLTSQSTLRSNPSLATTEQIIKSSFGSDPNVYYIDITIPESNAVAPIVEHGKGGHLRTKRDVGKMAHTSNRTGADDLMTRIIQYTGWHPVDLSNPLNNEPTVSYKPPPLQKVHFGDDPPATKPLYPIVPENPPVYVVRKDRAEPEIDEVYGTEKFEYLHIEPKSKTIRAFQPAGNPRIIKFVKRLDSVKPSEQSKRSHNDPNDYFLPPVNGPNFDISNLNFNISDYPNSSPDLDMSFTENKRSVSHPFLRILPPGSFRGNIPNVANARGILPTTITPQQILQARLNLARLPLMSPLHGLFGSFTQIPFGILSKSAGSGVGDSVVREVPPPALSTADLEQQASEPVRTVLFARSKQNIDRSDSGDYFDDEDELDRISFVPSKTRFGQSRYKPKKPSKTIAANSLSELLQIFKYTNTTEPPPLPTTTPPPVTIMKGFRYTKPTEPPPTTTTTRPTTTKRFRLPTAFRYSATNQPKSYIQNTLTTTEKPVIASRITVAPTLTPKASKKVSGIPDLIFDRVAETNSLDGYLFSDSEASPEFRKAEVKLNVIQKTNENAITPLAVPKALSSKRVSIRLIGENKTKDEIVHAKNSQPLKSEFEIIYTTLGKTTSFKPETEVDSQFTITQGHSKVSVFRPNNTLRVSTATPSPLSTFPTVKLSPVPHSSSGTHPSTSDHSAAPPKTSTAHSSRTETSPAESSSSSADSERFAYYDPNYDSYDYIHDATNARETPNYPELANYDEPSYLVRQPWLQREEPSSNPTQVSFTRLPPPGQAAFSSESGDTFLEPLPHAPPPPPLHFLEGLRRAMPTSAVPSTWQDFYPGTPEVSVTKEPSSSGILAPDEFRSKGKESEAIRVTGDAKSLIDVKNSSAALAMESGDDGNHHSPDQDTTSSMLERSQQEADRMSPSDRIAEEVKAAIIESIVTEPFETKRQNNKDDETDEQSTQD